MKIPEEVMAVLQGRVECEGPLLRIGGQRLKPRLYERVNEVLEGAGGRWDKRRQAHVFDGDAAAAVAGLVAAGEVVTARDVRTAQQYFPTPPAVVQRLIELADVKAGMEVLEPSAGRGALVAALSEAFCLVDAVELEDEHAQALKETGAARSVTVADFLTLAPEPRYDRVVMNPPFAKGAELAHVRHALGFLRPDGYLVSVMPDRPGEAVDEFRGTVRERGGIIEELPPRSFEESGTGVKTVIAVIPAEAARDAPVFKDAAGEEPARPEPAPPEPEPDLPSPAVLLGQIEADLRAAQRATKALRKLLCPAPQPKKPKNAQMAGQLAFDDPSLSREEN